VSNSVEAAAAEIAMSLDGTYGRTWNEVRDDLRALAAEGEQVYVDPGAVGRLIDALLTVGMLSD
jgi:hypothetical protein